MSAETGCGMCIVNFTRAGRCLKRVGSEDEPSFFGFFFVATLLRLVWDTAAVRGVSWTRWGVVIR